MKKILSKIFWYSISSKEKVEKYQQIIRDEEWEQIKDYIPKNSKFIDVGCGAGYSLMRAKIDLNCEVEGIDADPGAHGVGRFVKKIVDPISIKQGFAEKLPYEDATFDVVYSSHVLEHLHPEDAIDQVQEICRILRKGGKYICITPNGINGPHDISRFYGNDLVGFHLKEYLPSELKKLFIGAGFKRVRAYMMVKKRPIYISIRLIRLIEIVLYFFPTKTRKKLCHFSILKRINNTIINAIK